MSRPLPPPLATIAACAEALPDPAPVREALDAWRTAPWRVVVVGRVSVGKSTLVNALVGERVQETGLGGVTGEIAAHPTTGPDGAAVVVDTPALEARPPDAALAEADAVVWVVDGLQPVTDSERRALRGPIPEGTGLHVVVSRADLLAPGEVGPVLARVRHLTRPWAPTSLRAANLRAPALEGLLAASPWPSPRREARLRTALGAAREALDATPPPPDPEAARDAAVATWREAVRAAEDRAARPVREGTVEHRAVALRRLVDEGERTRREVAGELAATLAPLPGVEGPPRLPAPSPPDLSGIDLVGGLGGAGSALRTLRRVAARWALEGEIALRDWLEPALGDPDLARALATRRRLQEALDQYAR